tara:strand:- start:664 stop:1032 length:369 start_codon:yes stop_codon:yes gene_type:complete
MLKISLSWPPAPLSPNARLHWSKVAKSKKAYRKSCWAETINQVDLDKINLPEAMVLTMTFIPPDKREYDRDNLTARMKAGIDGLADGLEIDDKRFTTVIATVDKDGFQKGTVQISIEGDTDE